MASGTRTPSSGGEHVILASDGLQAYVEEGANRVVALLRAGIPLTLLLDLAEPKGPDSAALYSAEARQQR